MLTTISVNRIPFDLIGILFALCSLSMVSCGGGAINSVHVQDLRQDLKAAESERDKALKRAETAEKAIARVETARDKALKRVETAEKTTVKAETARDKALKRAETAEKATVKAETARDKALRRAETAEKATVKAETARDKALRRVKTAETERDRALRRAETAEKAIARAETARDRALRRAKIAEEELESLRELVTRAPQATIKNVSVNPKKRSMDISVTFSIKNRKDIEGSVYVYFYFQEGEKLPDKKGNPISISKKFTPKSVADTQTVKLSMSYTELNLGQPDKLMFSVRIYDKPTNSFLNKKHYLASFSYDSSKNIPVRLTDR